MLYFCCMQQVSNQLLINYIQSILDGFSVGKLLKLESDCYIAQDGFVVPIYRCSTARDCYTLLEYEDFLIKRITEDAWSLVPQLGLIDCVSVMPADAPGKGFVHRRGKLYFLYKLNPHRSPATLLHKTKTLSNHIITCFKRVQT